VTWVIGGLLSGRTFADDADLADQTDEWEEAASRPQPSATEVPALLEEATKAGPLPATAHDDGVLPAADSRTGLLTSIASTCARAQRP